MKFNEDVWNDGKFSIVLYDMGYNIKLYNWFKYNSKYQIEYVRPYFVIWIIKVDS